MNETEEFLQNLKTEFLDEAMFLLEQCEECYLRLDDVERRPQELAQIFRAAHTIKGGGATVGFTELVAFAHVVEDCLSSLRADPSLVKTEIVSLLLRCGDALKERVIQLRKGNPEPWDVEELTNEVKKVVTAMKGGKVEAAKPAMQGFGFFDDEPSAPAPTPVPVEESSVVSATRLKTAPEPSAAAKNLQEKVASYSVKVDAERVDQLLNVVGELVIIKSQLIVKAQRYEDDIDLHAVVARLESMLRELQDKALGFRMTPLKPLFVKTQRLVRDLSLQLEKSVDFAMTGEETEIDRQVVEQLSDPLLHIVRNSLDHGIELPGVRQEKGKPDRASITLSARQVGSRVLIRICDDGAGINAERVIAKAVERGLLPDIETGRRMAPKDVYDLLFMPGFSTAEQVTDLSGRGVGLDVVKTSIEKLKGTIQVESTPNVGTTIILSIPLTSSIADGILVKAGISSCILPMENIRDLGRFTSSQITELDETTRVIEVGGRVMPMIEIGNIFGEHITGKSRSEMRVREGMFLVVEVDDRTFGLVVDDIIGQVQVVLKPLDKIFEGVDCVSGVAILGDGHVALVLAPHMLAETYTKLQKDSQVLLSQKAA